MSDGRWGVLWLSVVILAIAARWATSNLGTVVGVVVSVYALAVLVRLWLRQQ
jgi:NADH:ubiquinone oxidoreductase subunit 6 (subunit J)